MAEENPYEKKLKRAAQCIVKAGILPFPISETLLKVLKFYLDEEDLDFISNFKLKSSLSHEELVKKAKIPEEEVKRMTDKLAKKGFIFNQPSSAGIMVYRLLPLVVVGTFEYTFMQPLPEGKKQEELKGLAGLYKTLLNELVQNVQNGYDNLMPIFKQQPPVDRTIPIYNTEDGKTINIIIDETIQAKEQVLPAQTVEEIINKFDDIAVGNCFCRQYSKMLGHNCEINAPMEVCFTFGKSARHTIAQGFARRITKDEAIKILKETDKAGLVHKAFHNGSDIKKEENSICNCCKDCCDTFNLWRAGGTPMTNSTNYLSIINKSECSGCGICVDRCPVDAIKMVEGVAERTEEYCIGCGICARFCPVNAISLRKGMRHVFVPPPRLRTS